MEEKTKAHSIYVYIDANTGRSYDQNDIVKFEYSLKHKWIEITTKETKDIFSGCSFLIKEELKELN